MKPLRTHLISLVLLGSLSAVALGPVVPIQLITGAPFQATLVKTDNRSGQHITSSVTVARSATGSTYWEMSDDTGATSIILIQDVPKRRFISLDVTKRFYSVGPLNLPSPFPDAPSPAVVKQMIAQCENKQTYHNSGDGYDSSSSYIGTRTQDGFIECGERVVYNQIPPTSKLSAKIWQNWTIPAMNLSVEYVAFDDNNQPIMSQKLTDIRLGEPNPSLFEIPSGYTPRPLAPAH
jgi:hypothetical protein